MSEPIVLDEIVALRNRLVDQRFKAEDKLSTILRNIGMGLAAISYAFVFSSAQNMPRGVQKNILFLASVCGAVSVLLDVVQSFTERSGAQATLEFFRAKRAEQTAPTAREVEEFRQGNGGGKLAFKLLKLRSILCFVGVILVTAAIWNAM